MEKRAPVYEACADVIVEVSGKSFEEIEQELAGLGYGALKEAVGTAVVDTLTPFQDRYNRIMADKPYIEKVLKDGAEKSIYAAQRTLNKVYKKVGFVLPK